MNFSISSSVGTPTSKNQPLHRKEFLATAHLNLSTQLAEGFLQYVFPEIKFL